MNSIKFSDVVCATVAGTIPFYVAGYYPPEKEGDRLPPHEHVESSSNANVSSQAAIFTQQFAVGSGSTVRVAQQFVIRY